MATPNSIPDQDIMEQFRQYRKLKTKTALQKVAQHVGATAEAYRTKRPLAETFAERAPERDTMTRAQKAEAIGVLNKEVAQQEQWSYEQWLDDVQHRRANRLERFKAKLSNAAEVYKAGLISADKSRARKGTQLEKLWQENLDAQEALFATTDGTAKEAGAVKDSLDRSKKDYVESGLLLFKSTPGLLTTAALPDNASQAEKIRTLEKAWKAVELPGLIAGMVPSLLGGKELGQGRGAIAIIAAGLDMSIEEFIAAGGAGGDTLLKREDDAVMAEEERLVDESYKIVLGWTRSAGQFGGDTAKMDALVAETEAEQAEEKQHYMDAQAARERVQQEKTSVDFGDNLGDIKFVPYAEAEAAVPGEAVGSAPQGGGLLGLGVMPEGTARDKTLQIMKMYEQYPEHPPLMEARNAIITSPAFADYKEKRGYGEADDDFVFRRMHREMKIKKRASSARLAGVAKKNVEEGIEPAGPLSPRGLSPGTGKRKEAPFVPKPPPLVAGGDERTPVGENGQKK